MADLAGCSWFLKLVKAKLRKFKQAGIVLHHSVHTFSVSVKKASISSSVVFVVKRGSSSFFLPPALSFMTGVALKEWYSVYQIIRMVQGWAKEKAISSENWAETFHYIVPRWDVKCWRGCVKCQSRQRPSYRKIHKRIIAHPVIGWFA